MSRRLPRRLAATAAVLALLAVPSASAATTDTATMAVSAVAATYHVGDKITFTSTTPCTVLCRRIWKSFTVGGPHLGEQLGEGESVTHVFTTPGLKTVQLDLSELCVGTSRLTCDSYAQV